MSILKKVGDLCPRDISVYLIGGGAMALRGEKDATRDLDLVLESEEDAAIIKMAFEEVGFTIDARRPDECRALVDAAILSKPAGLRADIFIGRVCDKVRFSEGMEERASLVDKFGNITLFICSREDIFLLKSVTERSRDLDDMMSLFRRGLQRDIILGECDLQTELAGFRESHIWEAFLLVKVEEMEKRYGVGIPWKRLLKSRAEIKMGAHRILTEVDRGNLSVGKLTEAMKEAPTFMRKCISYLEEIGEISVDRNTRPYRITKKK